MTRARIVRPGDNPRQAEREKRTRLKAELEQLLHAPLNEGVRLTPKARERIAERVRTGLMRQTFHAMNGGGTTRRPD